MHDAPGSLSFTSIFIRETFPPKARELDIKFASFFESIGFKKFSNYGWRVLNNHLKEIHTQESKRVYLYPRLDQYELYDQLSDLPTEELNKIKKEQLQYPWVLRDVIKNRA